MLYHIGSNHIFDDGTICFCLVCKQSVADAYPVDRDDAICQHFRSEGHEKSAKNLFKVCIPDPKCESRNIRYTDIVNNSEFEVWEQGNEPSYVSKKGNRFVCLICKEEVSKVCYETDKIKDNLQCHLESEMHKDNVKHNIWWTYHPNLDTNYIALNTTFMYCSFCQQILESKENCLLEFAADHIETELKKENSALKTKLKAYRTPKTESNSSNPNGVSKIAAVEEANFNDEKELTQTKSDSGLKTEIKDESSNDVLIKAPPELEIKEHSKFNSLKLECSEINLKQVTDDIKSVNKSVYNEDVGSSQIKEEVICATCNKEIEVLNDDIPFSILKHSQKHKHPSFDFMESEIKDKMDFVCDLCHERIEIFNKDKELSYSYHLDNFHAGNERCLVNIEKPSNDYTNDIKYLEESDVIAKVCSLLSHDLRDHLKFIGIEEKSLYCVLCKYGMYFSSDINTAHDVLQNHFSQVYHKNQYEAYVQKDIDHVEDDEKLDKNNQLLQGLHFNASTIIESSNAGDFSKNVASDQYNEKNKISDVPEGIVRSRLNVQKILHRLVEANPIVNENQHILDEKEGHFHCQLCDEIIHCTRRGWELIKHLQGEGHSVKLRKTSKGKTRTRSKVLKILYELSQKIKVINENLEDIGAKGGQFFCMRCDEVILCTLTGKQLIGHLNGSNHGLQVEKLPEEQRELRRKSRPSNQVYHILSKLVAKIKLVEENNEVLGEKQGHFYCYVCDEVLLCTNSGNKLIEHLRDQKHVNLLTT